MVPNRFTLRTGLYLLAGFFLLAFAVDRLFDDLVMRQVMVRGPIYQRIMDSQGMMIDSMPPTMYASEAYIAVHQLIDANSLDEAKRAKEAFRSAANDFERDYRKWSSLAKEAQIVEAFRSCQETGQRMLDVVNEELLPVYDAGGDNAKLAEVVHTRVDPLFREHRARIQECVGVVRNRQVLYEGEVTQKIGMWTWRRIGFDLMCAFVTLSVSHQIARRVLRIQREKDRLRLVYNISSSIFLICDAKGKVEWVNEGFSILFDEQEAALLNLPLLDFLRRRRVDPQTATLVEEVISYGTSAKQMTTFITESGSVLTVMIELQPMMDDRGNVDGFTVVLNDLTQQVMLHNRIASIFNSLSEGIVLQGRDGQIIDCNPAAEKLLQLSRTDILARKSVDPRWKAVRSDGSPWEGNTHPAMETLRTGLPVRDAIMGLDFEDGERHWISINTQPVFNGKGELNGVVASFGDMSKMIAKQERLNMAMQGAGLNVWEWRIDRDLFRVEGESGPMPGTGDGTYNRRFWRSMVHHEDLEQVERRLQDHLQGKSIDYTSEHRIRTPWGEWIWILETGRVIERNVQNQPLRVAGIQLDITQQKLLEQRLRVSETRTRQIFESTLDAIVCIDPRGIVVEWNKNAEQLFGWLAEEAISSPLQDLLTPGELCEDRSAEFLQLFKTGISRVLGQRLEATALHRDGRRLIIELNVNRVMLDGQETYTAFMRDVTEQKSLEAQLAQAQRLESIGSLAAGVAHEINTPVQFVNDSVHFLGEGFRELCQLLQGMKEACQKAETSSEWDQLMARLEALEQEADAEYLTDNMPKALDRAQGGLDRISEIVRSMRDFSHQHTSPHAYVDLNRSLQSTLTVARNEYKYVAEVETDFGDLPEVFCHGGELNQVFLNLVINAAHAIEEKYGDSGRLGKLRVESRFDGEFVRIRFQDDGCGIPEGIRHRIFEPFFTTKKVGKGTGQGLSIAYSIIYKKHGGKIEVESQVGVGSIFTVILPCQGPISEGAAIATAQEGQQN